jgi:hypothetical protein
VNTKASAAAAATTLRRFFFEIAIYLYTFLNWAAIAQRPKPRDAKLQNGWLPTHLTYRFDNSQKPL